MLKSLLIQNYALIDSLEIEFQDGFITITGETGAGKSILLGALGLLLGQRADTSMMKEKKNKCIIEGSFNICDYKLQDIFQENDVDYEAQTVIRRQISPSGKSRAFVNDIPVNLSFLSQLGAKLIDIHSQHENLILNDPQFQLRVTDTYANNFDLLHDYRKKYDNYRKYLKLYNDLLDKSKDNQQDIEYFQHQYNELDKANLSVEEFAELEQELEALNHVEDIKKSLTQAAGNLALQDISVLDLLKDARQAIEKIQPFYKNSNSVLERLNTAYYDLKDLADEVELEAGSIDFDSQRIEFINQYLLHIHSLQQKHRVDTVKKLVVIRDELKEKLEAIENMDFKIEEVKTLLKKHKKILQNAADKLSEKRQKCIPKIEKTITSKLKQLGMPNAKFQIQLQRENDFTPFGMDAARFQFSANKKIAMQNLNKVASGGEISRLMLSIKSLLTKSKGLPTIIFDEIDTGVSGDIADSMGNIMRDMAKTMQVISITHLPQIASKGAHHYLVYKSSSKDTTSTHIKLLEREDRLREIAKMLSGKDITVAALQNADELLKQNQGIPT